MTPNGEEEQPELANIWATVFILETTRFDLGNIVVTMGALEALNLNAQFAVDFLTKHANCEWGDLCEEDRKANDYALVHGERLLSAYDLTDKSRIYIITEHDRGTTTIVTPDEY